MAATVTGTDTNEGGQPAVAGYIVADSTLGGADVDMEDVEDALGARVSRIVYKTDGKISLNLIVTTGTVATDFPEGALCTVTGFTEYWVDSAVQSYSKGSTRAAVSMTDIGIT